MREESHLDDMRAAIRGDFERLQKRRGTQELMQLSDQPAETSPEAGEAVEAAEPAERPWFARLLGR